MQKRRALGLAEAMAALRAILQAAVERPGQPIAATVVDHHGDMVAFVCEAGANPALARQNALKKAYTSACMRVDSETFGQRLKGSGSAPEALNPRFTGGAGGLVIAARDGTILGGLGVSGRPDGAEDEAIARAGLEAIAPLVG